jgi:uncharacterized protein (DUF1810 family)
VRRFIDAQNARQSGFEVAMAELRAGRKQSHWIWYIFPQLRGLGHSALAEHYGLAGIAEAEAYLRDPLLRARLIEAAGAVRTHVDAGLPLGAIMGAGVDVLKLVSSMTLFEALAARHTAANDDLAGDCARLSEVARALLEAAAREGYPRCAYTTRCITPPALTDLRRSR